MAARRDYAVYEAINKNRREVFVGVTRSPIFETIGELREAAPWRSGSWTTGDKVTVRSLEFGLTLREAKAFAKGFAKGKLAKGWRRVG